MKLPWHKSHNCDVLRPIVTANLERLQRLFHARGKRFAYAADMPTAKLEDALWRVLDQTALDMGLDFPPGMPAEHRVSEIQKHLAPMPHPGAVQGSRWPSFLQTAR